MLAVHYPQLCVQYATPYQLRDVEILHHGHSHFLQGLGVKVWVLVIGRNLHNPQSYAVRAQFIQSVKYSRPLQSNVKGGVSAAQNN